MRFLLLLLGLSLAPVWAQAAVPQLSFDAGGTILRNPSDDDFILRSGNADKVRLTLYRLSKFELLNQVTAARVTQSVTEDGLLAHVTNDEPVQWKADFVLSGGANASPLTVPLRAATGPLGPGVYVLVASGTGLPTVAQWFHITDLALHVVPVDAGKLIVTTHRAGAVPLPRTRLWLLNAQGNVVSSTPNDWRTDNYGAVFWSNKWPDSAILLRADDDNGGTALVPLTSKTADAVVRRRSGQGVDIAPAFDGNSVPAGATARFDIALRDAAGRLAEETLRYEFARVSHRYRWLRDKDNNWQYQATATPTVIERGTLRPGRGEDAGKPVKLLLAVTEGRFKLTVSTPDGSARQSFEFTAGWWRPWPADAAPEIKVNAKLLTKTKLQIVAEGAPETDAPRWAVIWRPSGPQIRPSSGADIDLPADRVAGQPVIGAVCVPASQSAPGVFAGAPAVACGATTVQP